MMRQRVLDKNLGKDTHTRGAIDNAFTPQSSGTVQMLAGEIIFPEPEPLFTQNMVTVKMARGGQVTSVAYPGAFVEPVTGNVHGVYEGPIPGQMVMVGFENGNDKAPFVVNRYPYQGAGNSFTELAYINPLSAAGYHAFDVIMGHFLGSYISFNTGILPSTAFPGSITVNALTNLDMSATAGSVTLDALLTMDITSKTGMTVSDVVSVSISAADTTMESTLGGLINLSALVQIKNAAQSMKTLMDGLWDLISGATGVVTTGPGAGGVVTLDAATIALVATEKAKWSTLLKA